MSTEQPIQGGLLGVFPHPDDEQFGTSGAIAKLADRGIPVRVVCFTRGDRGEISDPEFATRETLGEVRESELRQACELLGILPPIVLDYGDGTLAEEDPQALTDAVVQQLRELKPRVVLTFDRNGGYGHPDHIALHHATVSAVKLAADAGHRPDLGTAHQVEKLYFTAYPKSQFVKMNEMFLASGLAGLEMGDVQTIADDEIGTDDERITTVVEVDDMWQRRHAAFRAHRTQYGPNSPFLTIPETGLRELMNRDRFVRSIPAPISGVSLPDESDLWQGLS